MSEYAYPETIVTTAWVASHAADANVRVVEVDVDTKAYDRGTSLAQLPGRGTLSFRIRFAGTSCRRRSLRN